MRRVSRKKVTFLGTFLILEGLALSAQGATTPTSTPAPSEKLVEIATTVCAPQSISVGREIEVSILGAAGKKATVEVQQTSIAGTEKKTLAEETISPDGTLTTKFTPDTTGTYIFAGKQLVEENTVGKANEGIFAFDPTKCQQAQKSTNVTDGAPVPTQSNTVTSALSFTDPFGIVFDVDNGEPVPSAAVAIIDRQQKTVSPNIAKPFNPTSTNQIGQFNFFVKPGEYYLDVTKSGYTFPLNQRDFKLNSTNTTTSRCSAVEELNNLSLFGYSSLYFKDSKITVQDKVVHVNVPVKSNGAPTPLAKPKIYQVFIVPSATFTGYTAFIWVNNPNTTIKIYNSDKLIKTVAPACSGFEQVELNIDPTKVAQNNIKVIAERNVSNVSKTEKAQAADNINISEPYEFTLNPAVLNNVSFTDQNGIAATNTLLRARSTINNAILAQDNSANGIYNLGNISVPYKLESVDALGRTVEVSIGSNGQLVAEAQDSQINTKQSDPNPLGGFMLTYLILGGLVLLVLVGSIIIYFKKK